MVSNNSTNFKNHCFKEPEQMCLSRFTRLVRSYLRVNGRIDANRWSLAIVQTWKKIVFHPILNHSVTLWKTWPLIKRLKEAVFERMEYLVARNPKKLSRNPNKSVGTPICETFFTSCHNGGYFAILWRKKKGSKFSQIVPVRLQPALAGGWPPLPLLVSLIAFYEFLSDPGIPGVRSMGPECL